MLVRDGLVRELHFERLKQVSEVQCRLPRVSGWYNIGYNMTVWSKETRLGDVTGSLDLRLRGSPDGDQSHQSHSHDLDKAVNSVCLGVRLIHFGSSPELAQAINVPLRKVQ